MVVGDVMEDGLVGSVGDEADLEAVVPVAVDEVEEHVGE